MRCVVAIVEGVEKSLLMGEVKKDKLPWFKKNIENGTFQSLNCGPVPYEPSNLATAFSGVGPGSHGCYSYWDIHNQDGPPHILEAKDVKAPRVWEWPEMHGLKFSVVNIQLTHPPQPLNGCLITYPMQQTLHATYPKDLQVRLAREGVRYAHDVSVFYKGEPLREFATQIQRVAQFQFDTVLRLAEDCDILIVNLTIADRLSHFLWSEIEDGSSHFITDSYQFLDRSLSQLESLLDETGSFMVFSEIGFGHIEEFVSINKMLQKEGLQRLDSDGRIVRSRTLAREAVQGTHGINLVSASESPVTKGRYAQTIDDVCATLCGLRFPDGEPVVASALPREEVYRGPYAHLAPDIIISPANLAKPPLGDPYWANHVNRELQTGWHRDTGFLMLNRKTDGDSNGEIELEQIAPTIARLFDRDIPSRCRKPSLV